MRRWMTAVVAAVGAAAFTAGWTPVGQATAATSATSSRQLAASAASGPVPVFEVMTGTVHGLGKVLVDGQGFTLYVFAPDKHSGRSTCYGRCASAWPPLVLPSGVSQAPAGSGVRSALLGTTTRRDGSVEVTYKKWPLYTWVVDTAPGDATGQDLNNLGGKWYVITPAGLVLTKHV